MGGDDDDEAGSADDEAEQRRARSAAGAAAASANPQPTLPGAKANPASKVRACPGSLHCSKLQPILSQAEAKSCQQGEGLCRRPWNPEEGSCIRWTRLIMPAQ